MERVDSVHVRLCEPAFRGIHTKTYVCSVLRKKTVRFTVRRFSRGFVDYVEVGVRMPTTLLPLDLRDVVGPSMELACVLGCDPLCGDCAAPVERGGVGPTEVSMFGGGIRPSAICGGNGAQ